MVVSTVLNELKHFRHSCDITPKRLLLHQVVGSKIYYQTEEVLDYLRRDEFRIIGIHGLAGVGKTTLALSIRDSLLNYSKSVNAVIWVSVSQNYNFCSLQERIAKAVGKSLSDTDDEIIRGGELFETLQAKGKFVLFLDDVWTYIPFERLGLSKQIEGCKIILTSRSIDVCTKMGCEKCLEVCTLSKEESWNLFKETLGRDTKFTPKIDEIAHEITRQCGGLPLAIVTMGSSMRGVCSLEEWRNTRRILEEAQKGHEDMDSLVFPVLKLSFDRLNNEQLKQCFLYCATYPEDEEIDKNELIELYVDVGMIKETTREAKFDKGHALIKKLENASLLLGGRVSNYVTMHDLIRDMALRIKESQFLVKAGLSLKEIPYEEEWIHDTYELDFEPVKETKYLDLASFRKNDINDISISPKCPRLSVLLLSNNPLGKVSYDFFVQIPSLKVLDLSYTNINKLPNSVGDLVKLNALIMKACRNLEVMPSLAKLTDLRKLDLFHTGIKQLPTGLEQLVKLRYFNLAVVKIKRLQCGILPKLHLLQHLEVDNANEEEVTGLKKLEILVTFFHDWSSYNKFVKSPIFSKSISYHIGVGLVRTTVGLAQSYPYARGINTVEINGITESDESLFAIPEGVQVLAIKWLIKTRSLWDACIESKFINLEVCQIEDCSALECLFVSPLYSSSCHLSKCCKLDNSSSRVIRSSENFSNLRFLKILDCHRLKSVFNSCFLHSLRSLSKLCISNCEELEEIITADKNENIQSTKITLPNLQLLELRKLPNLKSISTNSLLCSSLRSVKIIRCWELRRIPLLLESVNGQLSVPSCLESIAIWDFPGELADVNRWWKSLQWDDPDAEKVLRTFVMDRYRRLFGPSLEE